MPKSKKNSATSIGTQMSSKVQNDVVKISSKHVGKGSTQNGTKKVSIPSGRA